MLTMILGGLWHVQSGPSSPGDCIRGSCWSGTGSRRRGSGVSIWPIPLIAAWWTAVRIVATFHLVCLGWLIFRADSLDQAAGMLAAIFQRPAIPSAAYLVPVALAIFPLCSCSYFSTWRTISTSSAARPGMSVACSTQRVFMPSCSEASSAANSSFTFSFNTEGGT